MLTLWKDSYDQPRQHIKKQIHYFETKIHLVKLWFSSGHVWMWDLDYKESWVQKNWCFWIVMLEKTLESPLDCKEIKAVNPEGNQSWIFMGRTDVEAETPIVWPPDVKRWFIWKDPDAGKDWGQEEKRVIEHERVLKRCCWMKRRQDSCLWRRRIQSGARDEAWSLRAFV